MEADVKTRLGMTLIIFALINYNDLYHIILWRAQFAEM